MKEREMRETIAKMKSRYDSRFFEIVGRIYIAKENNPNEYYQIDCKLTEIVNERHKRQFVLIFIENQPRKEAQ